MSLTTITPRRRLQIAVASYLLIFVSPYLHDANMLVLLVAGIVALAFLILSLRAAVPGSARPSRLADEERALHLTKMRMASPVPQA
jgi:hypothetical protein